MRKLLIALLVVLLFAPIAFAQGTTKAIVRVDAVDVRFTGSVWVFVVRWRVCALSPAGDPECADGDTVEPLNAEPNITTNTRIENDAKAKLLEMTGITVNGPVHVYGGRTS